MTSSSLTIRHTMADTIAGREEGKVAPSLILMGMRGAGKTTLGRLAAEHMGVSFIDADEVFQQRHCTPKQFVAQHGWPAFRAAETAILEELLQQMRSLSVNDAPMVISLGGGVVEEEHNRRLLQSTWQCDNVKGPEDVQNVDRSKRIAVVHIFREVDKVLLDARGMPNWSAGGATAQAGGQEMWNRRRPWFRQSSSHEFVNFSDRAVMEHGGSDVQIESSRAARLRFEAVERDFVRFLRRLQASYQSNAKPWLPSPDTRSYLVTLPFADLHPHVDKLPLITLGANAIELRADLLHDPTASDKRGTMASDPVEAYENPSLSYLSEQVALIRRHLPDYPLVFTLRTPAQGGRYPYPADAPGDALFTSLRHALKLGCDVIDLEMELDPNQSASLVRDAKARATTVLISWRDKTPSNEGGFDWNREAAWARYRQAIAMGADIVKIVGTAGSVSANFALRLFAAEVEEAMGQHQSDVVPLSAYNMSYKGRISRFLNTTLASVTHPIAKVLTNEGVVGNPSMTFSEVQKALHLSGLTEKACIVIHGHEQRSREQDPSSIAISSLFKGWTGEMGLPFSVLPADGAQTCEQLMSAHDSRYGSIMGFVLRPSRQVHEVLHFHPDVQTEDDVDSSGMADCIVWRASQAGSQPDTPTWVAKNMLIQALSDLISQSISPSLQLARTSRCVLLTDTRSSNEHHDRCMLSAVIAMKRLSLEQIEVMPPQQWTVLMQGDPPLIIIDGIGTATAKPVWLFSNPEGGLFLSLHANDPATHDMLRSDTYRNRGWHSIEADTVHALHHRLLFEALTSRKAPAPQRLTNNDEVMLVQMYS